MSFPGTSEYNREQRARIILRHLYKSGPQTDAEVAKGVEELDGDAVAARLALEDLALQNRVVNVSTAGDSEKKWLATENPAP